MRDLGHSGWLTTTVPSSVFNSLIQAGQIKQNDIDAMPEDFSWVSRKSWIYRKIFDVPDQLLRCDRIALLFEGLDTIASIWLNNKLIGKTNNMFIPFRFDVSNLLKPRDNSLLVKFEPAVRYAKKLMNRYTTFSESDFENPHRVYVRKAQYQFGWDWCPPLPGCGIWRAVRLEGVKKAGLADLHVRTVDCNQHYADIKIAIQLDTIATEKFVCRLTLSHNGQSIEQNLTFNPGDTSQSTLIRIERPALWWPAGYGPQNLYLLALQLRSGDEIIDQIQRKVGIRTAKLNRSSGEHYTRPKQEGGEKFQFEVNGRRIFAKGANWVPASIFAGSVTDSDYEKLLKAAKNANINMLRVWGGGYYETDRFYQLCDQFGIMVWQDFMFACAYYPDRHWFLEEVEKEAAAIIKQLRNHPCLILWCGNNEIDWMHNTAMFGKGKKFYGKQIYHQLLPKLVVELDGDKDYIPTTPLRTTDSAEQIADRKRNLNAMRSALYATEHQWDVWSGHKPIREYLCPAKDIPKFVTEFGLQSMPNMETIKNLCPAERLQIGSRWTEKYNYQVDGNSRLYRYIGDLFGTAKDFQQFIYLSQITQARAVKTYVEHLRAHNFRNSGVLFWQFNDCCPAISWSAIDYMKRPKALYYYAKRFFAKLLITVVSQSQKASAGTSNQLQPISVIAINDSEQPLTAVLSCRLIDLFGSALDQVSFTVALAPFSTSAQLKLPKAIISPADPHKTALHLIMEKDGKKIAENLFFYLPDKYIDWPTARISKSLSAVAEKQWKLKLKSNAIAKDVHITLPVPAQFSDNFIDLIPPNESVITIDFERKAPSIKSVLQIRALNLAPLHNLS